MKKFLLLIFNFFLIQSLYSFSLFKFYTTLQPSFGILEYCNSEKQTLFIGRNLLQLSFITNPLLKLQLDFSLDTNILYSDYAKLYITKPHTTKLTDDLLFFYQIRKLYLTYKTYLADIYLGRQLLKFGEGIIFNPLDPFSKIDFTDITFSRIGSDAIRVKFPLSSLSYFETILLSENFRFNSLNFSTRILFPLLGYDISLIAYHYQNRYTSLGISFRGDLIVGIYGETVYTSNLSSTDSYAFSSMLGFDYSVFENIIFRLEYLNNQNKQLPIFVDITTPFCSSNYIATQIIYTPSIIKHIYLNTIYNLQTNSLLSIIAYQHNILQNIDVILKIFYQHSDLTGIFSQQNFRFVGYIIETKIKF